MLPTVKYNIAIRFITPVLGSVSLNKDLYGEFIGSKVETDTSDELEAVPEVGKGITGFLRVNDSPVFADYVVKGFCKAAGSALRKVPGTLSAQLRAHLKAVDTMVFVYPRFIPITEHGTIEWLDRPLRCWTMQGERVALARSEMIPEGARMAFEVVTLGTLVTEELLAEWFAYGIYSGLGQWRGAGYGRFQVEDLAKVLKSGAYMGRVRRGEGTVP